ncbi:S1C family serine protease [Streptomyces albireticuli]|nr:trypsin-like peptidase domain-containing protein [Streptomyces albireticuli]MCD9143667.1 trypsin-like peptidase domain-containing protein [Streptomyces albireticuli]MCD9161902.1 trypsin-like peptidase domain-containing protein [Streptomyces albireticuli]MCD9191784.1 trypsin-like peptidase domain-containing protein [Streptomyces albireticuli]
MSTENEGAAVPSAPGPGAGSTTPSPEPERPVPSVPPVPSAPPAAPVASEVSMEKTGEPAAEPADRTAQLPAVGAEGAGAGEAPGTQAPAPTSAPQTPQTPQTPHIPAAAEAPTTPQQAAYAQAGAVGAAGQPLGAPGAHGGHGAPGPWYGQPGGEPQVQMQPQAYGGAPGGPGAHDGVWGAVPVPPPRKRAGGLVAAVLVAALVAGGVGGGVGFWAANRSDSGSSTTVSASGDPKVESRSPGSVADIANKALPSVVTIEAQSGGGEGGTGTGFVYDKQGHILTNNHVVASAAQGGGKLTATFSNGKQYAAEVVGRAQGYDVAVLKLKDASGATLSPLPLGNSDKTAVGDATIAIGAPFGLSGTVTTGIVSAKKRPVASSDGGGGNANASYMSALQTDASINPGNSGGPLLNAQGAVIGINSAIQSAGNGGGFGGGQQQAGSIGLGFAIPINQAKNVADQLIKDRVPTYPVIAATVNMRDSGSGAKISSAGENNAAAVTPGGPADKAGLKPGDVITKLDGTAIDSGPTLISEIWTHRPGDKVTLTYTRDGKQATTEVVLGERKGDNRS